jgi:high-affinity iron transporter
MIETMVITLREGVEAALIVAIALAYLRKAGRADLFRVVYAALGAAVAVSVAGAVLMTRFNFNEDRFEGWIFLVAAVFVVTMVYWMAKTARHIRRDIEARLGTLIDASAVGLFLFIFFMVLREGVETVLILSAVSLNSVELLAWLGSLIGLALAVLFGIAFVKGSVRINLQRFFSITSAILILVAIQLLISGLHELSEAGVLPSSRTEMAIVGRLVRNDVFFFTIVLGLAGILLLRERSGAAAGAAAEAGRPAGLSATAGAPQAQPAATPAERRKARWVAGRTRLWNGIAYGCAFGFIVLIAGEFAYNRHVQAAPPADILTAHDGLVRLPVSDVADGNFHWYEVNTSQGQVRFFAVRRPNGTIALALDACQICGSQGYYQQANQIHCRNCDAPINAETIGTEGGCNPIPFPYRREGNQVVIGVPDLARDAPVFSAKNR